MGKLNGKSALSVLFVLAGLSLFDLQGHAEVSGFPGSPLKCLDRTQIEVIRNEPSALNAAYVSCQSELAERLRDLKLDEWGLKASFAVIAAHAMAPYGQSSAFELPVLMREKFLDCDNYAALTGYFVAILLPDHPRTFSVVGFEGKTIGNHAQLILRVGAHHRILADPTVGIIADVGYNALLSSKPVPAEKIQAFYAHHDADILKFGNTVYSAIASGSYRPSDLLYYFDSMKRFLIFSYAVQPAFEQKPINVDKIMSELATPGR